MPPKKRKPRGKNQQGGDQSFPPTEGDVEPVESIEQSQQHVQPRTQEEYPERQTGQQQRSQQGFGRPQQGQQEFQQQQQGPQWRGRQQESQHEFQRPQSGQQGPGRQQQGQQEPGRQQQGQQGPGRQQQGQQESGRQQQGQQGPGRQQGLQEFQRPQSGQQGPGRQQQGQQELQRQEGQKEFGQQRAQQVSGTQQLSQSKSEQQERGQPTFGQQQRVQQVSRQQRGATAWAQQIPEDSSQEFPSLGATNVSLMPSHLANQVTQTELRKQEQDDSQLLTTKLEVVSLGSPGVISKAPVGDTTKEPAKVIAASSGRQSEPAGAKPSPKKTQFVKLNIDYKMTPTIQQKFLPKRPDDGGKKGRSIPLIINCLNMTIKPMKVYMYDIELTKAEVMVANKKRDVKAKMEKKDVLRVIVYNFLRDKGGVPVFDGGKIIFSNTVLPIDNNIVNKIEFKDTIDDEVVTCYFNLQRVKEEDIELSSLTNYIKSGQGRSDNLPQEALRALDTVIKEMFVNKNLISLNRRAIYDPKSEKPLRCGPYLLLDGYSTTVRPHMWNVRFNFDKTQIVIHKAMNLYDYIGQLTDGFRRLNPDQVRKKIHLLRVEAKHLKNAEGKSYSRKYTIHGFSRDNATKEMIVEKNMTVEQYFQTEYNIKLKYPKELLIKTHPTKKTLLPMELLEVLPHQKVLVNDPQIVQEVIKCAAIPPFDRLSRLKDAIKSLKFGDRADKFLKNYMIEIDDNLINVNGRVLEGPEARFGGRTESLRGGKWDFRSKRFYQPHPHKVNWALFGVGSERDYQRNERPLFDIEEQLPGSANRVGVNMEPMYLFQYIPWQRIEVDIPNIIEKSEKEKKRLDLLVFVINRDEDYKAVKRFGDMVFGIATQCMKYATLQRQKAMDQYLANIMLKINTKLGGINWELMALVNKNFSPIKGRFMVFGIDVTHPASTKNDLSKSIAAMVGSLDHTASLYSAVIRQQISKEDRSIIEVVLDMEEMVYKLLMTFYKANKTLKPDHLLFYRDGVSEGQFRIVFINEITAIQNACARLDPEYQPKVTYIVVQKRHKIRFFPSNQKDAVGRSGNVPAGTVVDKDITHCREFDFYLCSHEGIQGTSKPAHYHVLFDENNWGSDDLQCFTHFLCHVYARSTRSVSYPAPTYYAHLAAFRGRALIGETFDDSSSTASGQVARPSDNRESEILIHDYHDNKLFFI